MINYLVWLLVVILYSPVFYDLYTSRWDKIDYSHAYFILPLSLWLVWRKRQILRETSKQINSVGQLYSFLILFASIIMFIFGWKQDYIFITTLSLIPLLFGLATYLYGNNIFKPVAFPVLYLLLLVPVPIGILDAITLPMRHSISVVTEIILRFTGYPVKREGLLLTVGYYDIFMGAPCSGFRSLITMSSLVLVYVYISKGGFFKKLVLTSCIIPFALLGNLLRVITLCLITFYFGEEAGQGFFHNFSGIVVFVITLLGLMGIESFLERKLSRGNL